MHSHFHDDPVGFLECMIDLRDRDVNDRVVQHMLKLPVNDGGQWDMLVNLVERYGVIPKYLYPETFSSSNTDNLNKLVLAKLRDHAAVLRRMAAQGHSLEDLRREKEASLKEIYTILSITLGEPPKGTFTWSFRNKDKKYYEFKNQTPQSFYKDHVNYPVSNLPVAKKKSARSCRITSVFGLRWLTPPPHLFLWYHFQPGLGDPLAHPRSSQQTNGAVHCSVLG